MSFHWLRVSRFCCSRRSIMMCSSADRPAVDAHARVATPRNTVCRFARRRFPGEASLRRARPRRRRPSLPLPQFQRRFGLITPPLERPQMRPRGRVYAGCVNFYLQKSSARIARPPVASTRGANRLLAQPADAVGVIPNGRYGPECRPPGHYQTGRPTSCRSQPLMQVLCRRAAREPTPEN
jgi:hypothetical protein